MGTNNAATKKIQGGLLAIIGFLLSPLSWWNDIVINIPLAYAFAFPFGLISKSFFLPAMILGYWITNILGFILMHQGTKNLLSKEKSSYTKKELVKDISISLLYTLLVIFFIKIGWLKFPTEYFQ